MLRTQARIFLLCSILMTGSLLAAPEPDTTSRTLDYDTVLSSQSVIQGFSDLVNHAPADFEMGAFVTRDAGGQFKVIPWPVSGQFRGSQWKGPIPRNVIAVAHTHPHNWFVASRQDLAEARRTGLPIFIVTRMGISVADPASGRNLLLVKGRWWQASVLLSSENPETANDSSSAGEEPN